MSSFRLAVDKALAAVPPFSRPTSEAILEIAYLAMAVDEQLHDEEIDAFSVIAASMIGGRAKASSTAYRGSNDKGGPRELDDAALRMWLDRFSGDLDRESIQQRLQAAVSSLGDDRNARLAAYRVACLMAMSDLDAADREFEFDLDLIATLGLTQDEADRIVEEVNAAVAPTEN
ncbi:MAG: hypothetical protein HOW73_42535 [Polyangiaceae bacterium]|nr:hypothetical protein [Polyangiaceae bacterium]